MEGTATVVGVIDGKYLLVEFQDSDGNVCYFHTDARVVWLPDGTALATFLKEETDEEIEAMIDAMLTGGQ